MTAHHYTDTDVKTAAAAVNAGTCLEDANMENNVFSHIGDAVKTVNLIFCVWLEIFIISLLHVFLIIKSLISEDTVRNCTSQLFMVRMKLGEFDPPEMNPYKQ